MSKRALKKYLSELTKEQLEDQILDLYSRFKEVRVFYNFVFSPKEEKLLEEAKLKISKEYFPVNGRKPKMRRSVAQKLIKHYIQIGVDPYVIAEIMLFNMEIAQQFSSEKPVKQEAFYKSMLKSFQEVCRFVKINGMQMEFRHRIQSIASETQTQNWFNAPAFDKIDL